MISCRSVILPHNPTCTSLDYGLAIQRTSTRSLVLAPSNTVSSPLFFLLHSSLLTFPQSTFLIMSSLEQLKASGTVVVCDSGKSHSV